MYTGPNFPLPPVHPWNKEMLQIAHSDVVGDRRVPWLSSHVPDSKSSLLELPLLHYSLLRGPKIAASYSSYFIFFCPP